MSDTEETMTFKNTSAQVVSLLVLGIDASVKPGETCQIPLYLAGPGRFDNGSRKPSTVETCTPQLRPADERELAAWLETPAQGAVVSRIVAITERSPNVANGVQAAKEAKAKALAAKTKKTAE